MLAPGRTVPGPAPCQDNWWLPAKVSPVMQRIVAGMVWCASCKDFLSWRFPRGTPDPVSSRTRWVGTDGWSRRAMRKSSASVPAQTDSRCVNRAVPVGIGVEVLLVLCLSQMELMVELHVDRRRDRAVTRMEKLTLELPT